MRATAKDRSTIVTAMAEPSFDVAAADRWFAIELNNATWAWLDAHETGNPIDPIVHAAHASYHHWRQAGTVIHQARAASLVSNVHSTVGNADLAKALALECLRLIDEAGEEATDWDFAFAHDSLARSLAAAGDPGAVEQRATARRAGDAIHEADDKEVFDDWFGRGNWHGIG